MSDGDINVTPPLPTIGRVVHVYTGFVGGDSEGPFAGFVTGLQIDNDQVIITYIRPGRRELDWAFFSAFPGVTDVGGNRWEWPPRV